MLTALLLSLLSTPALELGPVVLFDQAFELPESNARELGHGGERLVLALDGWPCIDILARDVGTKTERRHEQGTPSIEEERTLIADIGRAHAIALEGGDFLGWYRLLKPDNKDGALVGALREAHARGATLLASGAAAGFVSALTLETRERLDKTARNPRNAGPDVITRGLELGVDMLVDVADVPHGGIERTLRAAASGQADRVLILRGKCAWIEAPATHAARVLGEGTVLLFDLTRSRRGPEALRDVRVARLSNGDHWSKRDGVRLVESEAWPRAEAPAGGELSCLDVLLPQFFEQTLDGLVGEVRASDKRQRWRMDIDMNSTRSRTGAGRAGVLFDLQFRAL